MSRGSYWNQKQQRTQQVYREAAPRAVEIFAEWLVAAFGLAGVMLAEQEQMRVQREAEAKTLERERLVNAIEGLA